MTKEEAIKRLKEARNTIQPFRYVDEAIDYAIKALEQESVIDKIRAEIDELNVLRFSSGERIYKDEVLDIIDKYKAESENKE